MALSMPRQPVLQALSVAALSLSALAVASQGQALAQGDATSSQRAANLARMKAEVLNGGLGVYRAATCMHEQRGGACLVSTTGEGFTFRFLGGAPGWQQTGLPPTVETEILITLDGRSIKKVIYNGPPQQPGMPQSGSPQQQSSQPGSMMTY